MDVCVYVCLGEQAIRKCLPAIAEAGVRVFRFNQQSEHPESFFVFLTPNLNTCVHGRSLAGRTEEMKLSRRKDTARLFAYDRTCISWLHRMITD